MTYPDDVCLPNARDAVKHTDKFGHIILLRLLDCQGLYLPVYIGEPASSCIFKPVVVTVWVGQLHSLPQKSR